MKMKQEKIMTYRQQEEKIRSQSEAFLDILTKQGILTKETAVDKKTLKAAHQKRRKTAYHNTEMLLKNYRTFVWQLECRPGMIAEELDTPFDTIDEMLERIQMDIVIGDRKRECELASIEKSRALIDRINEALTVLKKKPENGKHLYELIYLTYIAPEKLSHQELLYRLNLSSRSYYRQREQAITVLSIRLWAAPTSEAEFMLDLLSLLETT